jgi:hypothetical protein
VGADLAGEAEEEAASMDGPARWTGVTWHTARQIDHSLFRAYPDALKGSCSVSAGDVQHDPDGPPSPPPKIPPMGRQQTRAWKKMLEVSPYALKTVKFGNIDGEEGKAPNPDNKYGITYEAGSCEHACGRTRMHTPTNELNARAVRSSSFARLRAL